MNRAKVGLHNRGLYPAFLDYNVNELKCRGMSAKVDLFSYGRLNEVLSSLTPEERDFISRDWLFLKKDGLFDEQGFFVTDFTHIIENPDYFLSKVLEAGFTKIYVEESSRFELKPLFEKLKNLEVVFMEFADDPYRKS
jgi:hypothetical protein